VDDDEILDANSALAGQVLSFRHRHQNHGPSDVRAGAFVSLCVTEMATVYCSWSQPRSQSLDERAPDQLESATVPAGPEGGGAISVISALRSNTTARSFRPRRTCTCTDAFWIGALATTWIEATGPSLRKMSNSSGTYIGGMDCWCQVGLPPAVKLESDVDDPQDAIKQTAMAARAAGAIRMLCLFGRTTRPVVSRAVALKKLRMSTMHRLPPV
jgi:hypothetical protein